MWKAFKWLIFYIFVISFLILGFSVYYISTGNTFSTLGNFINDIRIYLVIIIGLIFIPLLTYEYKKLNIKEKNFNYYYLYLLVAIFLSISYNVIGYYFNKHILFSNLYDGNNDIVVGIISTVLIGPIIEELMFRAIIYNNLKNKFSVKLSMLITTIVFAICHFNIIQMVYAFIFGYILVVVYEKHKNIKYSIMMHITSNLITTLVCLIIIKDYLYINAIMLVVSLVLLCLLYIKLRKGYKD